MMTKAVTRIVSAEHIGITDTFTGTNQWEHQFKNSNSNPAEAHDSRLWEAVDEDFSCQLAPVSLGIATQLEQKVTRNILEGAGWNLTLTWNSPGYDSVMLNLNLLTICTNMNMQHKDMPVPFKAKKKSFHLFVWWVQSQTKSPLSQVLFKHKRNSPDAWIYSPAVTFHTSHTHCPPVMPANLAEQRIFEFKAF